MAGSWHYRIRSVISIGWRGFWPVIYSPGLYIVIFLSTLAAIGINNMYLGAIQENGLIVMINPLNIPLNVALIIATVYLALTASISVSREQDAGTLEVLFYGPVDSVSYVLAKYLEQMLSFTVMAAFYIVIFWLLGIKTNFGFTSGVALLFLLAAAVASSIIALGILLSVATSKVRTSILSLIAILVLFISIQVGEAFLAGLDPNASLLVWVGTFFSITARLVNWISPFAYLNRGVQAIGVEDLPGYLRNLSAALLYSGLLLIFATASFQRRGRV